MYIYKCKQLTVTTPENKCNNEFTEINTNIIKKL